MSRLVALAAVACVVALAPLGAEARCASSFVQTWPEAGDRDVPLNAAVVVVFGDTTGVGGAAPALRLTSVRDRPVALTPVFDQIAGDGMRPQRTIVYAAERELMAGTEYRVTGAQRAHGSAAPIGSRERVHLWFRTGRDADRSAPRLGAARVQHLDRVELGCGPSEQVPIVLDGATDDRALPFARVRLARSISDLAAGRFVGDVLVPRGDDGVARLGHGMCFGNWELEPGDRFVARVSVVDSAFNESPALAPIVIEAR